MLVGESGKCGNVETLYDISSTVMTLTYWVNIQIQYKHRRFIGYVHEAINTKLHWKIVSYYSVQNHFLPA